MEDREDLLIGSGSGSPTWVSVAINLRWSTQTIFMKTFGCSHNQSDSEYMPGQLSAFGYTLSDNRDEADLWQINACTVKSPKTLKGHEVRLLIHKTLPALDLPKVRKNKFAEILPINVGCLGACTYCKTKHPRGHLGSYTIDSLVGRVRSVIADGVKETWLSSEDSGAYDFREEGFRAEHQACSIQPPLPKLLHSLSQSHRCSYSIWQARKWVVWVSTFLLWVILGLNMEKGIAEELWFFEEDEEKSLINRCLLEGGH
ncbi:hypothetical protein L6164_017186 [Bauhinia variegata]|uniref:Uncharacterized protein n=1 Tax=Bauhinia variegata TaxID=167791 RepID=A0ACB9N6X6_BAUVA|nr:hypothetical protein L6164_017186 [Bauhinia variegata]